MAENKKPRTNWSDKARRITGVIAVAVVILVIVLSVSLGKGKSAPSQTVKVEPAPTVVTESKPVVQESTEEVKTEEVEVKPEKVEIEAEPIIEIVEAEEVEAAAPEIEEAVEEAKVEETVETVPVVEEIVEEPPVVEEPKTEETVAVAPEAEVTEKEEVRVPEPVGEILVSVVTDKARVETENAPEAVKKLSTFSVSTSLGAEFGFKTGREYVTVFPRLDIAGEFRNVFSFGPVEIGARFDIASVFRPLDGTFLGHDFSYFLVGDNWAMDGTVDAKLMFSISSSSLRGYAGIGIGYSIASNVSGITSHTEPKVFGFNSAVVATGVLGLEWRISDAFSLSLEGQARYFMETKEYAVGAALRMGWNF